MSTTSRRLSKQLKGNKVSHTPGKAKGINCQADPQKRFFACHPHAHRLEPKVYARRNANAGTKGYGTLK